VGNFPTPHFPKGNEEYGNGESGCRACCVFADPPLGRSLLTPPYLFSPPFIQYTSRGPHHLCGWRLLYIIKRGVPGEFKEGTPCFKEEAGRLEPLPLGTKNTTCSLTLKGYGVERSKLNFCHKQKLRLHPPFPNIPLFILNSGGVREASTHRVGPPVSATSFDGVSFTFAFAKVKVATLCFAPTLPLPCKVSLHPQSGNFFVRLVPWRDLGQVKKSYPG
jgi:hypothetical protein